MVVTPDMGNIMGTIGRGGGGGGFPTPDLENAELHHHFSQDTTPLPKLIHSLTTLRGGNFLRQPGNEGAVLVNELALGRSIEGEYLSPLNFLPSPV